MTLRAVAVAFLVASASLVVADEIVKWTDAQGRVHFSNRPSGSTAEEDAPAAPPNGDEGWESVLEKKQGSEEFGEAADNALNSLQAQKIKKKRERDRAQSAVDATQTELDRAEATRSPDAPSLRSRFQRQMIDLQKVEGELAKIDQQIGQLRAMKAMGKARIEHGTKPPLGN